MPSTAIRDFHYEPESRELFVWFEPRGRQYKYFDVPEEIYQGLCAASSRGRFFNRYLRDRFEYRLVEDGSDKAARRRRAIQSS
jgi:hypothetical protein